MIYFENGERTERPVDLATSRQFTAEAQKGKCYQNSLLAMLRLRDSVYVEGYAIFYNDKICNLWHHGWLERNGVIIDTYPGLGERYEIIYFPGKRYTFDKAVNKRRIPTLHLRSLIFAIKTYHKSMYNNNFWLVTAAKLAILYLI